MRTIIIALMLVCFFQITSAQWIRIDDNHTPYVSIIAYDSAIITGTGYESYDLAVSNDLGISWTTYNMFPGSDRTHYLTMCDSMIYACTDNGIFCKPENEQNWISFSDGLLDSKVAKISKFDTTFIAIGDTRVFARYDSDTSWSVICDESPVDNLYDFAYNGSLILLTGNDGICESTDMGATWWVWSGYEYLFNAITIVGDTIIAASPNGVFKKIISTASIMEISAGLIKLWNPYGYDYYGEFEMFHVISNAIFLCGETGIYKLDDHTWYWDHIDLNSWVNALSDNGETLFAAKGYSGIWARPLNQLITGVDDSEQLAAFNLQVFPNPCSGAASMRLMNSEQGLMILDLFSISGKKIKRIMNEVKMPGIYDVEVDISDLPEGVYFFRFVAGEKTGTIKILKSVRL